MRDDGIGEVDFAMLRSLRTRSEETVVEDRSFPGFFIIGSRCGILPTAVVVVHCLENEECYKEKDVGSCCVEDEDLPLHPSFAATGELKTFAKGFVKEKLSSLFLMSDLRFKVGDER